MIGHRRVHSSEGCVQEQHLFRRSSIIDTSMAISHSHSISVSTRKEAEVQLQLSETQTELGSSAVHSLFFQDSFKHYISTHSCWPEWWMGNAFNVVIASQSRRGFLKLMQMDESLNYNNLYWIGRWWVDAGHNPWTFVCPTIRTYECILSDQDETESINLWGCASCCCSSINAQMRTSLANCPVIQSAQLSAKLSLIKRRLLSYCSSASEKELTQGIRQVSWTLTVV